MEILYEDNHLLVVYKEKGLLSQSDISNDLDLLTMLKDYIKQKYAKPGAVYLGLVHRLDRNTAGIMVYAKTSKAAARLSEQIKTRSIAKSYLAILEGCFFNVGKIGYFNDKVLKDEKLKKAFISKNGKEAKLEYEVLAYNKDKNITLVKVKLETGRFHQIRVQFSSRGYPLYGDLKYGSHHQGGYYLASYELIFNHPTLKEELKFTYFKPIGLFKVFQNEPFVKSLTTK